MKRQILSEINQFNSGDIIRIVSYEQNCGIDETTFTAIVIDGNNGLIAIPQDFQGHLYNSAKKGSTWEIEVEWLLENDVEVHLLERFDNLMNELWKDRLSLDETYEAVYNEGEE